MKGFSPEIDGISTAILIGILQGITIIFLFRLKGILKENSQFIWFVGFLLIIQVESFLLRSGYIIHTLFFINISVPLVFILGPLLYAYTQSKLGKVLTKSSFSIHCIPFILYLAYSFNFFLQPSALKYNIYLRNFHPQVSLVPVTQTFESDPWNIQGLVVVELISFHLLIYSVLSLVSIYKNRKQVSDKIKIQWLTYINTILFLGSVLLFLSQGGVVNGYVFFRSPFPRYAPDLWISVVMYAITVYLILKPQFFRQSNQKYQKSSLPAEFKKVNLEKLQWIMNSEKPFLHSDFSLNLFAKMAQLSKHHISQILNEELNMSFYEFTHQYRIDEAKKLLNTQDQIKMESLALQLGYKSKATFFSAFKKTTGMTPLLFKERGK